MSTTIHIDIRQGENELTFRCRYYDVSETPDLIEASLIDVDGHPPTVEEMEGFAGLEDSPEFWEALCDAVANRRRPIDRDDAINSDTRI